MTDLSERIDERNRMVDEQLAGRGIRDPRVLAAFRRVPRHRFLPRASDSYSRAYQDAAQRIAEGQTISQPFIVALMTEALQLTGHETVLEIGAGSGYQTAILAELARNVVAVERHTALAQSARRALAELGYGNVRLNVGDGSLGWPESAPYDAILVAATAPDIPPDLIAQLRPGGRLILPVGPEFGEQRLIRLTKHPDGRVSTHDFGAVAFVPLIGVSGFGLPDDLGATDI
ncbi:MAG: protein-L-isoaspartate(D-aspartate) O-methyltransferase [Capsulimonadales bacterium]|nr:protein-L-isoaspartate(D-aspartate) O-methyltransferase [Capsulimonadales bacterium]